MRNYGLMREFVSELSRYSAYGVVVPFDELLEKIILQQLIDVGGFGCLYKWEIVKINPDVFGCALVNVKFFRAFYSENQIVEIACPYFQFIEFHGPLRHGAVGKGQAMCLQWTIRAVLIFGRQCKAPNSIIA